MPAVDIPQLFSTGGFTMIISADLGYNVASVINMPKT